MTGIRGWRRPALLALAGVALAPSLGAVRGLDDVVAPALDPVVGEGPSGTAFAETFDRYDVGRLPPQGGWTSSYDPIFTVVTGGIRDRSAQHASDGFGEFVVDTLLSPVLEGGGGPVAVTLVRTSGAVRHQLLPVDLDAGLVLTRVELASNRRIRVLQPAPGGFEFVSTGRLWTADVPVRIGVSTDETGTLRVFVDGEAAFTGVDLVQAIEGRPGRMDLLAFSANNDDDTTRLLIDDVSGDVERGPPPPDVVEIPTLGPAAALALAAGLALVALARARSRGRSRISPR